MPGSCVEFRELERLGGELVGAFEVAQVLLDLCDRGQKACPYQRRQVGVAVEFLQPRLEQGLDREAVTILLVRVTAGKQVGQERGRLFGRVPFEGKFARVVDRHADGAGDDRGGGSDRQAVAGYELAQDIEWAVLAREYRAPLAKTPQVVGESRDRRVTLLR